MSDDLFLVIDLSKVYCGIFRTGAKSVADIDTGEPKFLLFDIFTVLSLLFLPRGPNSIANFDGGPWPDLPPWIRH